MSDNWADEATKTYTPSPYVLAQDNRALQARIAELERQNALLTAVVNGYRAWRYSTVMGAEDLMRKAFSLDDALTDAGFPWTEPTP